MAGEPEAIAPEVEAPAAPIEPEADESVNLDDLAPAEQETEETNGEAEPQASSEEDDLEEFEWNGKPIKGPKGLKDGVLMHADYTRKTQAASARDKELDAREARIAEQAKVSEEEIGLRAQLYAKSQDIEQYRKVDWDAWVQQDPIAAQQGHIRWQQLEREAGEVTQQLQQRATERSSAAQQERAKRLNETLEYARKEIKGWSPDLDTKIGEFARTELGVADEALQAAMNPQMYRALHLAYLGHQTLTKAVAPKIPTKPPTPLTVVAAKANPPAQTNLETADMEHYVALRKKGIGNSRRG